MEFFSEIPVTISQASSIPYALRRNKVPPQPRASSSGWGAITRVFIDTPHTKDQTQALFAQVE